MPFWVEHPKSTRVLRKSHPPTTRAEIDDVFPQWEGGFPLILGGGHIIEQRSGTLRGPSYRHLERKLPFASGGREGGIVLQLARSSHCA